MQIATQQPLGLGDVQPLSGVALQQPGDDGEQRARGLRQGDLVVDDRVQHAAQRVAVEGRFAAQRGTQQHAQGPQVRLGSGTPARHPLRGGVLGRADEPAGLGERGDAGDLGDAEVGEHHPSGARLHQDVGGLEVAVQHAAGVRGPQRAQQRDTDPGRLTRRDRSAAGQPVGERRALDQLHHDPRPAALLDDVMHDDHVRVLDLGDGPRLAHRALTLPTRLGLDGHFVQMQLLHGHLATQQLVGGTPDRAHSATAQPYAQAVPARDQSVIAPEAPHGAILPHGPRTAGVGTHRTGRAAGFLADDLR